MTILIIGAKGMLGQALREVFREENEVVGWDKEEIDITQAQSVKHKVQNLKPQVVVNAAAYNNVDGAEAEPEVANAVNGYAVGYLAAVCRELAIPMVHYSTDYVFDGTKKKGYLESDEPRPISKYGYSKFLGEQELQRNTEKFYLIRLSRLFGKDTSSPLPYPPSPRLDRVETGIEARGDKGGGDQGRKNSFVALMLELAKTKPELEVVDEEVSCPTYAPDLAKRTREIVEQQLPFGIYHGANAGACTWYGFAVEIFKLTGINVRLIPVPASRFPRPAKRPQYGILLNNKLPQARPWQEALKEFLRSDTNTRITHE